MPGVLRLPCRSPFGPPNSAAKLLAGECACAGSWQLAHDWRPDADSDGSAKIFSPSAASGESGVSPGADPVPAVPPPSHAAANAAIAATGMSHARQIPFLIGAFLRTVPPARRRWLICE